MRRLLIISFFCGIISCEKEIPLDVEQSEPRIVVNSLFSAGDTIWVHLSESRDILYDQTLPNITDATAKLLDASSNTIGTFVHEADGNYYLPDFTPAIGETYSFSVAKDGFAPVTAQSETPDIVSILSIDTVSNGEMLEFDITFNDNGSQDNFYEVTVYNFLAYDDGFGGIAYEEYYYLCTTEIITENGNADIDGKKCADEFYFSDATFNGSNYTFSGEIYKDTFIPGVVSGAVITVKSLSEDLYKYKLSYTKYQEAEGNPFAEPVQVYSNIVNGFGIFGGSSSAVSDTIIIL